MAEEVYIGPGEEWLVLTCHNPACRATLLIEPVRPEMLDEDGAVTIRAETLRATCPHCKLESVYRWAEIRRETGQQRH
jgi:transposase-like protein